MASEHVERCGPLFLKSAFERSNTVLIVVGVFPVAVEAEVCAYISKRSRGILNWHIFENIFNMFG